MMTTDSIAAPPLSRREVELLAGWERERKVAVTLDDIRRAAGKRPADVIASSLVRKGALERVVGGVYLVRPLRTLLRPTLPSSLVRVAATLQRIPYYFGGLWALTYHHLTDQQFVSTIDAFVTRRPRTPPRTLASVTFHVVSRRSMAYGIESAEIERFQVRISNPERTVVDLLDHGRSTGLGDSVALIASALERTDLARIVAYAVRGSRSSTCQRLGVLLERQRRKGLDLEPLLERARERKSLLSMLPGAPRTGPVNKRWNVVENDR